MNPQPREKRLKSLFNSQKGNAVAVTGWKNETKRFGFAWELDPTPTDTILPTQILDLGSKLVARHSEGNYSSGRFELRLQSNGDLGFFTRNVLLDAINSPYLEIQSGGSGHQVKFNQSGLIYFNAINGSVLGFLSNKTSTSQFYQRAILEYDGVFRHYVYPKSANSTGGGQKNCTTISFVPPNKCTSVIQETGAEACGFNSYCQIESDGRRQCLCPSGYIFFDPDDEMGGCKPKFLAQSCDTESQEADHFNFSEVVNLDWPWSDYEHYELVNEEWCKDVCLNDCFCAVAIFGNNNCWKKKNPLSNGRLDPSVDRHAFVKVRNDNSTFSTKLVGPKKKDQTLLVIGLSSLALLLFLLLLLNFLGFNWFRKRNLKVLPEYANKESKKDLGVFTYKELEEATNGFQEVIGKGAFATVYKGILEAKDGMVVAVKKLDGLERENKKEFKAEVSAISGTNHKNLVRFIGYCEEGQHLLLVYEFMRNGSLSSFLFQSPRPNWYTRVQIAFGVARGLYYLHEECNCQIIHCDIKPQTILLDGQLEARISDFGLAKLLKADKSQTTTAIRGTRGYVALEWFANKPITTKVDVYSFGIMLLEIICCRRNFEAEGKTEKEMVLEDWAYKCYKERRLELLVENDAEAMNDMNGVEKFVMIALWCTQEDPSLKPTMKTVSLMLEGVLEAPVPPDPPSFVRSK
ncbi:Non-specific serine/threonine protein kinase [Bertholletia excelsa]